MSEKKELKEEELDKVSGGWYTEANDVCPHCGEKDFTSNYAGYGNQKCECNICGTTWSTDGNGKVFNIVVPEKYDDPKKAIDNMVKLKDDLIKKLKGN